MVSYPRKNVTPVKTGAGISSLVENLDSRFRGNDGLVVAACPVPLQSSVRPLQLCDRIEHFLKLPQNPASPRQLAQDFDSKALLS